MPYWLELADSRVRDVTVRGNKLEIRLGFFDYPDEDAVAADVEANLPATWYGLPLEGYRIEPLGRNNWEVTATYAQQAEDLTDPTDDMASFQFDTTGGSQRIRLAREVMAAVTNNDLPPPDYGGLIGVNGDRVEGVDVPIPQFRFQITGYLPQSMVTLTYARTVEELTGRVNDATFKGFPRGEVLFLGAKGGWKGREKAEMTFEFAVSRNTSDFKIAADSPWQLPPPGDPPLAKEGWWYADVLYQDDADDGAKRLIKRPWCLFLHRVMEYGDFSLLGIGT